MTKRKHRRAFAKPSIKLGKAGELGCVPIKRLYWAYGSNLCHQQMRERCPKAEPFAPLYLSNGVLTFRGVADVEVREGGKVAGGLYRITRECEKALDTFEGVSIGTYEKRYLLLEVDGKQEKCLYYRKTPNENGEFGVMPPTDDYLNKIARGYRDFKLDKILLDEALMRSWGEKNKTKDLELRWIIKGRQRLARLKGERK